MKIPQAWVTAGTKKAAQVSAKAKVTARIDMSAEVAGAGLCPDCRKPMDKSNANGIPVFVCHSDRIAIPIPDEEPAGELAELATFGPSTAQAPF